jgi:hypothetical protein
MLMVARLAALGAVAGILMACAYVGYLNEQLKGAIGDVDRAILLIGFLAGAAGLSRYLGFVAMKSYRKAARERRH